MRKFGMTLAFVALFTWAAWAQNNSTSSQNSNAKTQELNHATKVIQQMTSSNQIPQQLLAQSQCVAVIPSMTKAGFVVGGKHGTGVVSCRTSQGGWSAPGFISISGGSLGLQAGVSNSEIVLLMNRQGKQQLLNGSFQVGAKASVAGPTGSNYNASTSWKAPILSYTRSNGAYVGANVQGSNVSVDNGAMRRVYGSNVTLQSVLQGQKQVPQQAQQFVSALPKA